MEDSFSWQDEDEDLGEWQRRLADNRPTEYFIDLALSSADPMDYVEALNTLQVRATPEVLAAARELCGSPIAAERQFGADILSRLGDTVPILRVARRLRMSGEDELQEYADEYFARFGLEAEKLRPFTKEALAILLPMLDSETDIETLRAVLCAVAEYQDFHPSITERLAALRTHPDPHVRFTVATRLSLNQENPVAQQALRELANDEDEDVARVARDLNYVKRVGFITRGNQEETPDFEDDTD